jgi:hypothetical protein
MNVWRCQECKYYDIDVEEEPCKSCSSFRFEKGNWEAKE